MPTVFDLLAELTRRRVLDLLLERSRPVGELAELLGLTQPGASKHLRALRDAGLVRVRPDKQQRWYELAPEPLAEVDAWLRPYRRLWADRLDALERHLDAMPAPGGTTPPTTPASPPAASATKPAQPAQPATPPPLPAEQRDMP